MRSLYVSHQGCYVSLQRECAVVKRRDHILAKVQLPLLEQILIFGKSQVTTQLIRACLFRNIPIAYLSRMGLCYGRLIPIERGYRQLSRYQQQMLAGERLVIARQFVWAKLKNSRVMLQRQRRRRDDPLVSTALEQLKYLADLVLSAESTDRLMGLEGAGAASYFSALGACLKGSEFMFMGRSKRPPGNPVNAMLSFGYQILWNHFLSLIELQGLDPYQACLHQGSERHAALASDLIEEFRAPIIDSLMLYLVNKSIVDLNHDFEHHDGGCFLSEAGRRKFLAAFLKRMEEKIQGQNGELVPRWDCLSQQIKAYKRCVYDRTLAYQPYLIR